MTETKTVVVRVTPAMKSDIEQHAKEAGYRLSSFARIITMEGISDNQGKPLYIKRVHGWGYYADVKHTKAIGVKLSEQ